MTDVLLVAPDLNERRMILAELVEAGYRVLAVEAWPPRPWPRPGAVVIDVHGLPDPRAVLDELGLLLPPERVIVLTGTLSPGAREVHEVGPFQVLARPIT